MDPKSQRPDASLTSEAEAVAPRRGWQILWCGVSLLYAFLAVVIVSFELFVCFGPCDSAQSGLLILSATILTFLCVLAACMMINAGWRFQALQLQCLSATGLLLMQQTYQGEESLATLFLAVPFAALSLAARAWHRDAEARFYFWLTPAVAGVIWAMTVV